MTVSIVKATLTGADQWSAETWVAGKFNLILQGTWIATVHVQRYFVPMGQKVGQETIIFKDWKDVEAFTSPGAYLGEDPEGAFYRFGIKEGNHTSGEVEGRLSQ